MDLSQRGEVTSDLFTPSPRPGAEKLMALVDSINEREGRGAVRFGRVPKKPKWGYAKGHAEPTLYDLLG